MALTNARKATDEISSKLVSVTGTRKVLSRGKGSEGKFKSKPTLNFHAKKLTNADGDMYKIIIVVSSWDEIIMVAELTWGMRGNIVDFPRRMRLWSCNQYFSPTTADHIRFSERVLSSLASKHALDVTCEGVSAKDVCSIAPSDMSKGWASSGWVNR